MMVDPAIAYQNYTTFQNGVKDDIFLKQENGSIYQGVVWPGVTAFPDWFHPNVTGFWNGEFARFFNAESGVDIDGVWIDMNEPSNVISLNAVQKAYTLLTKDVVLQLSLLRSRPVCNKWRFPSCSASRSVSTELCFRLSSVYFLCNSNSNETRHTNCGSGLLYRPAICNSRRFAQGTV
jgi:hypothetical protein